MFAVPRRVYRFSPSRTPVGVGNRRVRKGFREADGFMTGARRRNTRGFRATSIRLGSPAGDSDQDLLAERDTGPRRPIRAPRKSARARR